MQIKQISQNLDLEKQYAIEFREIRNDYDRRNYKLPINKLLKYLKKENNPVVFRNRFLALMQLFFNRLIKSDLSCSWEDQKIVLDDLCLAGKDFIGSFYDGSASTTKAKETLLKHYDKIMNPKGGEDAKTRHLDGSICMVQKFAIDFQSILSNYNDDIDSLVCVASGGFEPSFLLMHIMQKNCLFPVRYSERYSKDEEVLLPKSAPENYLRDQINEKRVLVIDDIVESGKTLKKVVDKVKKLSPSKVYECAPDFNKYTLFFGPLLHNHKFIDCICKLHPQYELNRVK